MKVKNLETCAILNTIAAFDVCQTSSCRLSASDPRASAVAPGSAIGTLQPTEPGMQHGHNDVLAVDMTGCQAMPRYATNTRKPEEHIF